MQQRETNVRFGGASDDNMRWVLASAGLPVDGLQTAHEPCERGATAAAVRKQPKSLTLPARVLCTIASLLRIIGRNP